MDMQNGPVPGKTRPVRGSVLFPDRLLFAGLPMPAKAGVPDAKPTHFRD
jgi:hypothetical protein